MRSYERLLDSAQTASEYIFTFLIESIRVSFFFFTSLFISVCERERVWFEAHDRVFHITFFSPVWWLVIKATRLHVSSEICFFGFFKAAWRSVINPSAASCAFANALRVNVLRCPLKSKAVRSEPPALRYVDDKMSAVNIHVAHWSLIIFKIAIMSTNLCNAVHF